MPAFTTKRDVPFSPSEMFHIVADVEKYPLFVPMCEGLTVLSREVKDGRTVLVARMSVGYKAIRESFTTRVTLTEREPRVDVAYLDGPFRKLKNRWRFLPAPGGCTIDFFMDYEFRSPLLALVAGAVFDKAFRRFAAAFEARAHAVYGRRQPLAVPAV